MILGFPRAKQGLFHTKHGGAGGIILWTLLTVFLVLRKSVMNVQQETKTLNNSSCSVKLHMSSHWSFKLDKLNHCQQS